MHRNFGEWYRLVALEPDGSKLAKRWAGVKAWANALRNNDNDLLETVRIFQGIPQKTSREAFLEVFRKEDPAFPQRNELELQVVAGASLVACVLSSKENIDGLRAAVLSGAAVEASSLRANEPRLKEISREIITEVQALSVEHRKRTYLDPKAINDKADAAIEAMKQVTASSEYAPMKIAIGPVFQAIFDALRGTAREIKNAAHNLRCADEESNILWWVEGRCSRDTNLSWKSLKAATAIIAGSELADLTDVAIGPSNIAALLERAVLESQEDCTEAPLSAYVESLPKEWATLRTEKLEEVKLDLAPLMLATFCFVRSGQSKWQQYFDSSSGTKSSMHLAAVRVARQAYVEAILLRTLAVERKR